MAVTTENPQFADAPDELRKRMAAAVAAMETAGQNLGKRANKVLNCIDRALGDRLAEAVAASKTASEGASGVSVKHEPNIHCTGVFRIDLADVLAGRVAFAHAVEGTLGQQALCRRVDVVMPDGTIMHVGRAHGSGLKVTFEAGPKAEAKGKDIAGRRLPWPFEVEGVGGGRAPATESLGCVTQSRLILRRWWNGHRDEVRLTLGGEALAKAVRFGDKFHVELRPAEKTVADDAPKPVKDPCVRWPSLWGTGP